MPTIREVKLRHAEHFYNRFQTLATPDATELPLAQRLNRLRSDWGQITTAQAWSAKSFENDDEVAEICSRFGYVGVGGTGQAVCEYLQNPMQRIDWISRALWAARKMKHKKMVAVHLTHLGMTALEIGQTEGALEAYKEAETRFAELEDWESQAVVWDSMGMI